MIASRATLAALSLLLSTTWAAAQAGSAWAVRTIDGRALQGRVSLTADGRIEVLDADGTASRFLVGELLHLEQPGVPAVPPTDGHRVWLRSGSNFGAVAIVAVADGDGGSVTVEPVFAGPVEFSLRHLSAFRFHRAGVELPTFTADRAAPALTTDYMYVRREADLQRFSVTVTAVTDADLGFELRGKTYSVKMTDVAAVVFGSATGFAADRQQGPRATVGVDTGDAVSGRLLALGDHCTVRLDEGVELHIPTSRVRSIAIDSDRLLWLSSTKPEVQQTAAFDRVWPVITDQSPKGGPIRLGGRSFDRGLVLVPRTRLTWGLAGRYDVFAATIGIEDSAGPQAHAIFRVLADGKVLHESEPMVLGTPPADLELPISGVGRLSLEVDFGKNYDLGDVCVFADARVLKR